MNKETEAFALASRAAELHFESAMRGLIAGHNAALERMREELSQKDQAFLMALALGEKGARIDKDGVMVEKIAESLRGRSLCAVEKRFLERADANAPQDNDNWPQPHES